MSFDLQLLTVHDLLELRSAYSNYEYICLNVAFKSFNELIKSRVLLLLRIK